MFNRVSPHLPIVEKIQITLRRPVRCGLVQTAGQLGRTAVCSYLTVDKNDGIISNILETVHLHQEVGYLAPWR